MILDHIETIGDYFLGFLTGYTQRWLSELVAVVVVVPVLTMVDGELTVVRQRCHLRKSLAGKYES